MQFIYKNFRIWFSQLQVSLNILKDLNGNNFILYVLYCQLKNQQTMLYNIKSKLQ